MGMAISDVTNLQNNILTVYKFDQLSCVASKHNYLDLVIFINFIIESVWKVDDDGFAMLIHLLETYTIPKQSKLISDDYISDFLLKNCKKEALNNGITSNECNFCHGLSSNNMNMSVGSRLSRNNTLDSNRSRTSADDEPAHFVSTGSPL